MDIAEHQIHVRLPGLSPGQARHGGDGGGGGGAAGAGAGAGGGQRNVGQMIGGVADVDTELEVQTIPVKLTESSTMPGLV